MSGNTDRRAILFVLGLAVSAVGTALLSVFLDAGTPPAIFAVLLVGIGVGLSLMIDGLQRRVELGTISAVVLLVGAGPILAVGVGAIRVYLADPTAVFGGLVLLLGIVLLAAGLGMLVAADWKLDLTGATLARVTG